MFTQRIIFSSTEAERFALSHVIYNALKGAQVLPETDITRLSPAERKSSLRLAVRKGEHVKTFDGGCNCGDEWYVAPVAGCPFNCEYCYLNDYLDSAIPTIFVNVEDMLAELRAKLSAHAAPVRIHAGHLADALALDHLTGLASRLANLFREFPQATLELRTKTDNIESLLKACLKEGSDAEEESRSYRDDGKGLTPVVLQNVVISWTMSPETVIKRYEHGASPLDARIDAAAKCANAGFRVGMRLDPIIMFDGWRDEYGAMVAGIFDRVPREKIESWVLGCLRYRHEMLDIIRREFPKTDILDGELLRSSDGKYRYFRPLRLSAYQEIARAIRAFTPDARIDLCMETPELRRDFQTPVAT